MRRRVKLTCLLLAALLLTAFFCNPFTPDASGVNVYSELVPCSDVSTEHDDLYRTFYEVFVYSFCDSDGDGIGDLKGLTSKLDYIQDMGFDGIWLMPIHPSVTYHKYDVMDYYEIDPQYGTMEDFDCFLAECEKRDIRVILDLVLNHTGVDHPWFRQAAEYLAALEDGQEPDPAVCPYVDYYFFEKEPVTSCYYNVEGIDWQYEGKFWSGMPDLNLGNEALREEIRNIMQFWLDKGVAGFRLDAAKEFYSGSTSKNCEVLSFLMDTARSLGPDVYLVAEVWESFTTIADYYASGITSIFNFPFGDASGKIVSVLRGAGNAKTVTSFATAQEKAYAAYRGGNPDFIDAPFLSNHDTGRIAGFCSYDENKIKLAGAMNLFMSGNAFVYYGEELGMTGSGNDPSKRAPMLWNEARDDGTTIAPPECELPESYPFGSLELQRQQEASIWNYYRQAIAIRKDNPVIYRGTPTAETALNANCVSAVRKTWQEESCIILMNIQDAQAAVDLTDYADYTLTARLTVDENQVMMDGSVLTLPPYAVAVLTQNK